MAKKRLDRELDNIESMRATLERIDELREGADLNRWERDFLDSIAEVVSGGNQLSVGQEDKLSEIEDEAENGRDYLDVYGDGNG